MWPEPASLPVSGPASLPTSTPFSTANEATGAIHTPFAAALLDPNRTVPDGIVRANGGDPREAFNVYRNNVVSSLADALKAAFPITSQLLGEGLQRALMADYARLHPPKSAVLAQYGATFPTFLADHPATKARPFLADIARLERDRLDAYHAADAQVLEASSLGGIDPSVLASGLLIPHPAAKLIASRFPIATIYRLEQEALAGTLPPDGRKGVDLRQGEQVLLTRPLYEVVITPLSSADTQFIGACLEGQSFGVAASLGVSADPGFDLQACLALCLTQGVFTGFQPIGEPE